MKTLALLLAIVLAVSTLGDVLVEASEPSDFVLPELLGGAVGAGIAGVTGFYSGYYLAPSHSGWDAVGYAFFGGAIGLPIGATAGVGIVGGMYGVQGNLVFAFVLSIVGEFVGWQTINLAFLGVPMMPILCSSIGAVIGYNLDAQMASRDSQTATWVPKIDVPLLTVAF